MGVSERGEREERERERGERERERGERGERERGEREREREERGRERELLVCCVCLGLGSLHIIQKICWLLHQIKYYTSLPFLPLASVMGVS